jgi:hypothetical protein
MTPLLHTVCVLYVAQAEEPFSLVAFLQVLLAVIFVWMPWQVSS